MIVDSDSREIYIPIMIKISIWEFQIENNQNLFHQIDKMQKLLFEFIMKDEKQIEFELKKKDKRNL